MKRLSFAIALLSIFLLPAAAHATTGWSTAHVNMRSGPSTWYPAVAVVPPGSAMTIYGCVEASAWCDVSWAGLRGWVSGQYLTIPYQSRRVVIAHSPWIHMPVISFHFDSYWDRHYRGRPFYRERSHWQRRHRDYHRGGRSSGPGHFDAPNRSRWNQQAAPTPVQSQPQQSAPQYHSPSASDGGGRGRIRNRDADRSADWQQYRQGDWQEFRRGERRRRSQD